MAEEIPAATLVLWRQPPGGTAELLMVERGDTLSFAPGALVFPGGRVDAGDRALAAGAADPDDAAARVAAIRETIEEVGVAVAVEPPPGTATLAAWRRALAAGTTFDALLAADGHRLAIERLVPFARWCPTRHPVRNFDTRFFLAEAPEAAIAAADGIEGVRAMWATAAAALADADAGRHKLIFPTRRNLERLAALPDFGSARADAEGRGIARIEPWIEQRGDAQWLCIPEQSGYPVTSERLSRTWRG